MKIPTIRAFFIGCVQSSEVALTALLGRFDVDVIGILTMKCEKFNSDFVDLSKIVSEREVPIYYEEDNDNEKLVEIIKTMDADVIFCVGWSRLLSNEIIALPPLGTIGFHPSALPQNRGRHPLIWALVLGLEKTASTFFLMQKQVDSGAIVSQEQVMITQHDTAKTLYDKVLKLLPSQVNGIVDDLVSGDLNGVPQDETMATSWRKRSESDGKIDWRMSANAIYNLVRALTYPYVGAEFSYQGNSVKLWRCEVVLEKLPSNAEPGKVLWVDDKGPVIKTGLGAEGGAVRILDLEFCPKLCEGDYL